MTKTKKKRYPISRIETIMFQRKEGGKYEPGLLFNEGSLNIIDKYSEVVTECWNYSRISVLCIETEFFTKKSAQ